MKLNNKDVTKKYLTEPFNNLINKKGFATNKNTMYIIRGTTGLGKTYATFNDFIPTLFGKHNLDLVIYSYPKTEVFDIMQAKESVTKSIIQSGKAVYIATTVKEARTFLKKGYKVLLCLTHQAICVSDNGKRFMRDLEGMGLITGYFVDESHSWMISHIDNYRNVMGSNTPKYEGGLFKMLSKLAERTPYVFGLTATPNAEQINKVPVIGSMGFELINHYPKLEETIGRSGWIGSINKYDLEGLAREDVYKFFYDAVELHLEKSYKYGKRTMMIKTERANGSLKFTMDNIQSSLRLWARDDSQYLNKSDMIAVMTSNFKGFINFVPCGFGTKIEYTTRTEDEIKDALASPEHNCQILLVVDKGDVGMSIHNLKTIFSFRKTDKEMTTLYDKEPITENAIQTVGRAMRINTGVSNEDFTDEWGYDLTDYVKGLKNDDEVEGLLELNSLDLYVPNNEMWNAAEKAIRKDLCPSKEMANAWIKEIRNNI
jgi:hypothetical protein